MQTDSIFYRLFNERRGCFFEIVQAPPEIGQQYNFESYEVKQTSFRIDGFFAPKENPENNPLYFVEVQFRYEAKIYSGLLAEIFLYLNQNNPAQDWRAVVIFASRDFEPRNLKPYRVFLESHHVQRIYLDELPESWFNSLDLAMVKLIITKTEEAVEKGRELLARVKTEIQQEQERQDVLNLVTTILAYKFSQISKEELERMFGLQELRQTRFAQEMLQEGRQEGRQEVQVEMIGNLLGEGFELDRIARILNLELDRVRYLAQRSQQN